MDAPSFLYTSESLTEGHTNKCCGQISEAILDAMLAQDSLAWRIELQVFCAIGQGETPSLADGTIGTSVLQDQQ